MIRKLMTGISTLAMFSAALMACQVSAESEAELGAAVSEITTSSECHVGEPGDDGYCTTACPCTIGEADCNSSTECAPGLVCTFNVGANHGYAADTDVCLCPAQGTVGSSSFCSELCPCAEGQGDCDTNAECAPGLTCYRDAGAAFGLPADLDVCASCLPDSANGSVDFCSASCQCSDGQGDCDTNADCATGLTCFNAVGADFGLPPDTGVCAACPPPSKLGSATYCSASCQCSEGEGDCDSNAECAPGMTCFFDAGADFGLPADLDVCATCPPPSKNGSATYCSAACPCSHGEGDCDTSSECAPGLFCANDAGAQFGLPATTDVCIAPA